MGAVLSSGSNIEYNDTFLQSRQLKVATVLYYQVCAIITSFFFAKEVAVINQDMTILVVEFPKREVLQNNLG